MKKFLLATAAVAAGAVAGFGGRWTDAARTRGFGAAGLARTAVRGASTVTEGSSVLGAWASAADGDAQSVAPSASTLAASSG